MINYNILNNNQSPIIINTFKGNYLNEIYELYISCIKTIKEAKRSIYLIDSRADEKTLELLSHKKDDVEAILFTINDKQYNSLTRSMIENFNMTNKSLKVKNNYYLKTKFMIIDYDTEDEKIYCIGENKEHKQKIELVNNKEDIDAIDFYLDLLLKEEEII